MSDNDSPSFEVAFDNDNIPETAPLLFETVAGIKAGATKALSFEREASSGERYWVLADYKQVVPDSNRYNNLKRAELDRIELPDLLITDISHEPMTVTKDTTVTWTVEVSNNGESRSGPFTVGFDDDQTPHINPLETREHKGLEPGASAEFNFEMNASSLENFWWMVDTAKAVKEITENNNLKQGLLNLPDLMISNITHTPTKPAQGEEVSWVVEILNLGT